MALAVARGWALWAWRRSVEWIPWLATRMGSGAGASGRGSGTGPWVGSGARDKYSRGAKVEFSKESAREAFPLRKGSTLAVARAGGDLEEIVAGGVHFGP